MGTKLLLFSSEILYLILTMMKTHLLTPHTDLPSQLSLCLHPVEIRAQEFHECGL